MTSKVDGQSAEDIVGMDFQKLVASLAEKMSDEDLENIAIDELKTSIGPLRVPVKAYAEIAKLAQSQDQSIGNFVLATVGNALGIVLPLSEGKGRKKTNLTEQEKKAAVKVANAQKAAQVQRILAELGVGGE